MMIRQYFVFLIISITCCVSTAMSQYVRPPDYDKRVNEVKKLTDKKIILQKISGQDIFEPDDPTSIEWHLCNQLKKVSSVQELEALAGNDNPYIKCYAFRALVYKGSDYFFPVLLNHLYDTSLVFFKGGCIASSYFTGDFFLRSFTTYNSSAGAIRSLSARQKKIVDSILVTDPLVQLGTKYALLQAIQPQREYYEHIREFAHRDSSTEALMALARFNNPEDRPFIASFFSKNSDRQVSALRAVEIFPDAYFFPYVKDIFETGWQDKYYNYARWRFCYKALAKYPTQETLALFVRTISPGDKFRYETLSSYLLLALKLHHHEFFAPVKAKLDKDKTIQERFRSEFGQNLNYYVNEFNNRLIH